MCGRLVNLDTVARVLAEYYHLKTDTQLAALNDALSRVPAETVGKELFGNSEQLESSHFADFGNMVGDIISRAAAIDVVHNYWKEESRKLPRKIVGEYEVMDGDYKSPLRHNKKICEAIEALPSAQQNCDGCKWSDAIGYGECHHCKRAYDDMYEKGVQP